MRKLVIGVLAFLPAAAFAGPSATRAQKVAGHAERTRSFSAQLKNGRVQSATELASHQPMTPVDGRTTKLRSGKSRVEVIGKAGETPQNFRTVRSTLVTGERAETLRVREDRPTSRLQTVTTRKEGIETVSEGKVKADGYSAQRLSSHEIRASRAKRAALLARIPELREVSPRLERALGSAEPMFLTREATREVQEGKPVRDVRYEIATDGERWSISAELHRKVKDQL